MNTIDLVILVVVLIGLVRGLMTGGIKQVLSFAGIVIAFLIAAKTTAPVGDFLSDVFNMSERLAPIVAFAVVFLIIQGVAHGLARLLVKFLKTIKLGVLDKVLGGGIGALKATLVFSLVLMLGGYVGLPDEETREDSMFYNTVHQVLPATWEFVTGKLPHARKAAEDAVDTLTYLGREAL